MCAQRLHGPDRHAEHIDGAVERRECTNGRLACGRLLRAPAARIQKQKAQKLAGLQVPRLSGPEHATHTAIRALGPKPAEPELQPKRGPTVGQHIARARHIVRPHTSIVAESSRYLVSAAIANTVTALFGPLPASPTIWANACAARVQIHCVVS